MKKVDLPIVEKSRCQEAVRNVDTFSSFTIHESFVCAGGVSGQDTCEVGIAREVFESYWKQVKDIFNEITKQTQFWNLHSFARA